MNSGPYYGNISNSIPFNAIGKSSGSRQQIASSNSSSNIGGGRQAHHNASSSSSLDELGREAHGAGNSRSKIGNRSGHGSKRANQKITLMGSFDLDQPAPSQIASKRTPVVQNQTHGPSHSYLGSNPKQTYKQVQQKNAQSISYHQQYLNSALSTFQAQASFNVAPETQYKRKFLRMIYILIKANGKSTVQSHIDKLTQISKQSLKHSRKLASSGHQQSQNSTGKNPFFTEEIQTFINNSCILITGTFFKKWVDFAQDKGRIMARKDRAITQMFLKLSQKHNQMKFDTLLMLHKYKLMVQKNSGQVKQRTQLSFKLSQMYVAFTLTDFLFNRAQKSSLHRYFSRWSLQVSFSRHKAHLALSTAYSSVQSSSKQPLKPYEDPAQRDKVQKLAVAAGCIIAERIVNQSAMQREFGSSETKLRVMRAFQRWLLQSRAASKQGGDGRLALAAQVVARWMRRQVDSKALKSRAFLRWKAIQLEALRLEACQYKSIKPQQSLSLPKTQTEFKQMLQIDESLIRVQSEVALALEARLDKQLTNESDSKLKRILSQLLKIYEVKKDLRPRVSLRHALSLWANATGVKLSFSRVSKYLYEIDISNGEKRELETKIQQLNEDNELMQLRIRDHTMATECQECRVLQMNRAMMVGNQQSERRSQAWEEYSNRQQPMSARNDGSDGGKDFESEVQRMPDEENRAEWDQQIMDEEVHRVGSYTPQSQRVEERLAEKEERMMRVVRIHGQGVQSISQMSGGSSQGVLRKREMKEQQRQENMYAMGSQSSENYQFNGESQSQNQNFGSQMFRQQPPRMYSDFSASEIQGRPPLQSDSSSFIDQHLMMNQGQTKRISNAMRSVQQISSDQSRDNGYQANFEGMTRQGSSYYALRKIEEVRNNNEQHLQYPGQRGMFMVGSEQALHPSLSGLIGNHNRFAQNSNSHHTLSSIYPYAAQQALSPGDLTHIQRLAEPDQETHPISNDVNVLVLEQENSRLRQQEDELRQHLAERTADIQRRRYLLQERLQRARAAAAIKA